MNNDISTIIFLLSKHLKLKPMKKNLTFKVALLAAFCLISLGTIVISCRKTQTKEIEKQAQIEPLVKSLASTEHSLKQSVKNRIIEKFRKLKLPKKITGTVKSNSISINSIADLGETVSLNPNYAIGTSKG